MCIEHSDETKDAPLGETLVYRAAAARFVKPAWVPKPEPLLQRRRMGPLSVKSEPLTQSR
jgi:hypothetical protein